MKPTYINPCKGCRYVASVSTNNRRYDCYVHGGTFIMHYGPSDGDYWSYDINMLGKIAEMPMNDIHGNSAYSGDFLIAWHIVRMHDLDVPFVRNVVNALSSPCDSSTTQEPPSI